MYAIHLGIKTKLMSFECWYIPVEISGTVMGESPDCLLLSGTVVGENLDHVCWDVHQYIVTCQAHPVLVKIRRIRCAIRSF